MHAVLNLRHVQQKKIFVWIFVQSVIRFLQVNRNWLIPADVLKDLKSVSALKTDNFKVTATAFVCSCGFLYDKQMKGAVRKNGGIFNRF